MKRAAEAALTLGSRRSWSEAQLGSRDWQPALVATMGFVPTKVVSLSACAVAAFLGSHFVSVMAPLGPPEVVTRQALSWPGALALSARAAVLVSAAHAASNASFFIKTLPF